MHTFPALAALLMATGQPLGAQPSAMYVYEVAPLFYRDKGVPRGVLYEMMLDLRSRTGHAGPVIAVPLRRELVLLSGAPDSVGTLARSPLLENQYRWLCKLWEDRILLVASAATDVGIATVEEARALRLGVVMGSPSEELARALEFTRMEPAVSSAANAGKLARGRIDVWMVAQSIAEHEQRQLGSAALRLRLGAVLQPVHVYLAAGRRMDDASAARWEKACADMQKDGTHARILQQYGYRGFAPE
ncbi:transporter substrate-binding domain-containing protein [Pseudoduganella sp. LjRoot289]|uniref:substrate-binding periplasmic protein n=1 Tax=Pseudoduganella sp. LjRoot289 TaxID=3342314 RepID=UPI003ED027BA